MRNKKFISIIWGYSKNMYSFSPEENYHLHALKVAKNLGFEPWVLIRGSKTQIENDPNFDTDIRVVEYKNIFNYIYTVAKFSAQQSVFYVNSLEWQSFIVPFIARRSIFMAHTQPKRQDQMRQRIQNFVYKFFTAIRLNNETERRFLIDQGVSPKKLFVVPLIVSQDVFKLTNHDQTRTDLVYFGNVTPKKNLATILKAFVIVQKIHNDIRLHIIGTVWDDNFPMQISELGLKDQVLLHGYLAQNEILNQQLNTTAISLNSSLDEGQCVSVYDTALAGNALCLPNTMSFVGVFKDKALFHDIYDHEKLAGNILYYLSNPDIIESHRNQCIEMITKDFSKDAVEHKLKELLSNI